LTWQTFNPGRTFVLGSNEFCNGSFCTGFSFVRCGGGYASAPGGVAAPSTAGAAPLTPSTTPPAGGTGPYLPGSGFPNPMANGAPVDWCATYATNCGAGGVTRFCQQHGFATGLSWQTFQPGRTFVLGSNQFCNGSFCTGFSFVRCG